MNNTSDLTAFRLNFPSLPRLAYLNSGSYGLLASSVRSAFDSYLDRREEAGADWHGWIDALEETRRKMARVLSVAADEVAIITSASAGFNVIATALDYAARPRIVVSNFDFPTGAQIWHAQEKVGAVVVHVAETADGVIPLEALLEAIDERTAIVALSQVCYRNGGRLPDEDISAIASYAHAKGALVLLDAYQIVGSALVEPRALGVDFCVGGMLKYLLGTAGVGFLYADAQTTAHVIPRASGWFAQANCDAMDIFVNVPSPSARRFESGTPPVPNCIAASAGLDLILGLGLPAIERQVEVVTALALEKLAASGIAIGGPTQPHRRGPLVTIPAARGDELVSALAQRGVITSCRDGRLRAGFHAYNDEEDVERLVTGLLAHRVLLDG